LLVGGLVLQNVRHLLYGDQGTVPLGFKVGEYITAEHQKDPYHYLMHLGDIACARPLGLLSSNVVLHI